MSSEVHVHRKLPSTEIYACSKKEAKSLFGEIDSLVIHFGEGTHFEFDKGVHQSPELAGTVVATATVDREGEASLCFFPIRKSDYAEHEHLEFVQNELAQVLSWLKEELGLPDTRVVSNRQFILESVVDGFKHHQVHFA
jgi:hypothetical protein